MRALRAVGATAAVVLVLSACAPEPVGEWSPPGWGDTAQAQLISGLVHLTPEELDPGADGAAGGGAEAGTDAEADAGADGGADADPETPGVTPAPEGDSVPETDLEPETETDASDAIADDELTGLSEGEQDLLERKRELQELGIIEQRIRNDALPLQARWVTLPMAHEFNTRMEQIVHEAIDATGESYTPRVSKSGLEDRGCLPGSLAWPADQVLTDVATGVPDGVGTAITCEIAGAFGPYIGASMRVVTGDDNGVTTDERTTVYANLDTGELVESDALWNSEAAPALWEYTIDLLRRELGALSAAPVAPPSDAQVALAATALDSAQVQSGGSVLVTLPPGLAAPELETLGVTATVEPVQVLVEAETAVEWANLGDELLADAVDEPFAGLPAWSASTPVDCDLVPCIAVTYDDGPGEFTPQLLETLRAHRAPATFFMLGRSMRANPETVAAVAADGHEIGSHTMQHPDLTTLKKKEMRDEVMDAADMIEQITGNEVTSYRPPYGAIDKDVRKNVKLPAVLWSIDTLDWERPGEKLLIKRAVTDASPGDIVLFHDIHEPSVEAAEPVFAGLRSRGFVPVTVTQLFDGDLPKGTVTSR